MITLLPHKIQLPQWEESVLQAEARYQQLIKDLADKYPTENLLLVTHGKNFNSYPCQENQLYNVEFLGLDI